MLSVFGLRPTDLSHAIWFHQLSAIGMHQSLCRLANHSCVPNHCTLDRTPNQSPVKHSVTPPCLACKLLFAVAVKRARILKEGSLSLIPYGMDERLRWAERIGQFTRQARCAPT